MPSWRSAVKHRRKEARHARGLLRKPAGRQLALDLIWEPEPKHPFRVVLTNPTPVDAGQGPPHGWVPGLRSTRTPNVSFAAQRSGSTENMVAERQRRA